MSATMTRTDVPGAGTDDAPVYAITIQPDGTTTQHTVPSHQVATSLFQSTATIVSVRDFPALDLDPDARPLMWVGDWSAGQPVNGLAWLLYARSPICGPAVFALDEADDGSPVPIPSHVVDALCGPVDALWALLRQGSTAHQRTLADMLAQLIDLATASGQDASALAAWAKRVVL